MGQGSEADFSGLVLDFGLSCQFPHQGDWRPFFEANWLKGFGPDIFQIWLEFNRAVFQQIDFDRSGSELGTLIGSLGDDPSEVSSWKREGHKSLKPL